jgi:peptidyl-prolyl cis-trans isomerase D
MIEDDRVAADRQNIYGLPNSREIVKWVNTAKKGALSEIYSIDNENRYVVAYLKNIYTKGFIPLKEIKGPTIAALVSKEKKAAHIMANIHAADLVTIASNHGKTVVSAQKTNLAKSIFQDKLVGSIFGTPVGSISKPIEGSEAVYVIEVTAKDTAKTSGDFMQIKQDVQERSAANAIDAAYQVLKTKAEVKDNLSVIY